MVFSVKYCEHQAMVKMDISVYLRRSGCSTCQSCACVWAQQRACVSGSVCAGWRSWWLKAPGAVGWWGWQPRWGGGEDPLGRPRYPALRESRWKPGSARKRYTQNGQIVSKHKKREKDPFHGPFHEDCYLGWAYKTSLSNFIVYVLSVLNFLVLERQIGFLFN